MTVAISARGICTCGRNFIIFQPEKRELAQKLSEVSGDWLDVIICDQPEAYCSQCEQAISLPIPEELDTDRHSIGLFLEELERRADSQKPTAGQADPGDFLEWLKSQE